MKKFIWVCIAICLVVITGCGREEKKQVKKSISLKQGTGLNYTTYIYDVDSRILRFLMESSYAQEILWKDNSKRFISHNKDDKNGILTELVMYDVDKKQAFEDVINVEGYKNFDSVKKYQKKEFFGLVIKEEKEYVDWTSAQRVNNIMVYEKIKSSIYEDDKNLMDRKYFKDEDTYNQYLQEKEEKFYFKEFLNYDSEDLDICIYNFDKDEVVPIGDFSCDTISISPDGKCVVLVKENSR